MSVTPAERQIAFDADQVRHSVVSSRRACTCGSQSEGVIASASSRPSEQAVCPPVVFGSHQIQKRAKRVCLS